MTCKDCKNVDRLSNLPEELISHILSSMPTIFAVRTCILSKRWRYSWTSVTNLDFDDNRLVHGLPILSTFIDRVLDLCKAPQVNLFRLHYSKGWARKSGVSKWINEAVRLNVRELDIQVDVLELPLSLFTCKTLTKLRLENTNYDYDDIWESRSSVSLPCLKTLDMVVSRKPLANAFKLINGCPILESLSLELSEYYDHDKFKFEFDIPTLKRLELTIWNCKSDKYNIILNVPNLEYLFVRGILCLLFVVKDLSSLVKASISFFHVRNNHSWDELLKGISRVKSLSWLCTTNNVSSTSPMPVFPNLKHLELLWDYYCGWSFIPRFLENSPELEHLRIEKPKETCWIEPKSVPTCMLTKLRTIQFTNFEGREYDIKFLEYMLGNAEVLKTITITYKGPITLSFYIIHEEIELQEEKRVYLKLLKLPRASRYCEIHFHGKWFHSTSKVL